MLKKQALRLFTLFAASISDTLIPFFIIINADNVNNAAAAIHNNLSRKDVVKKQIKA